MKRILGLILIICFAQLDGAKGQSKMPASGDAAFFTVQIQALSKELPPNHFDGLNGVWMRKASDGLFKYYHGRYATEGEARAALASLRKKGFSDAFLVSSQRFILSAAPTNTASKSVSKPTVKPVAENKPPVKISVKPASKSTAKVSAPITKPETQRPENIKEGTIWTVQLSAFKYPVYLNFFDPLKNIMEFQGPDKYFKYCIGKYNDYDDAQRALDEYKEMGYDKAFVVDYEKYLPYLIE